MMKICCSVGFVFLFVAFVWGQTVSDKPQISTIRVTGEATVSVPPDEVTIDIGVQTRADNAAMAASQNARKLEAVLAELRKILGSKGEIKTTSYSLSPNYVYPPQGGEPKLNGYNANNVVRVKTDQLDLVGRLIDAGTQAGANRVDDLSFGLKDQTSTQAQALKEASRRARAKAESIAEAMGVKIKRILQVEEGGPSYIPLAEKAMMRAEAMDAVQTPVEPGKLDIQAVVNLTVEVEPS